MVFFRILVSVFFDMKIKYRNLDLTSEDKNESIGSDFVYYAPTSFFHARTLLSELLKIDINATNYKFYDIGSGKGAVLIVAKRLGFKKISGIEYQKHLCEIAEENISRYFKSDCRSLDIEIVHTDIMDYQFEDVASVFYMFNPFTGRVLDRFVKQLASHSTLAYLVYYNNQCRDELKKHFTEIYRDEKSNSSIYIIRSRNICQNG